jgi:primosomal protein N' (replication factor Y)
MSRYAEIVLGLPLTQTFTYAIPETCRTLAQVGSRVLVPFHQRKMTGFIVGLHDRKKTQDYEYKDIQEVLDDEPVFTDQFLSFTRKFSDAHFSSWGEMLQAALPPSYVPKTRVKISLSEEGKAALLGENLSEEERDFGVFPSRSLHTNIHQEENQEKKCLIDSRSAGERRTDPGAERFEKNAQAGRKN